MKLLSIASGSSGNCIYIGDDSTHLLFDVGISKKRVDEGLQAVSLSGADLTGILITHEHIDHIQGLGVFSRAYEIPIYATEGTLAGIRDCDSLGRMPEGLLHPIRIQEPFRLGDLLIRPFAISHDANEPCGYRVEGDGKSVAVATDMGTYDEDTVSILSHLNAIVLEANHDVRMLEVGPYPYPLKRRIMADTGHLSNEGSGRLLNRILSEDMQQVILGHLSKENNYPDLAYETVKLEITLGDCPYNGEEIPLMVASREKPSPVVTL